MAQHIDFQKLIHLSALPPITFPFAVTYRNKVCVPTYYFGIVKFFCVCIVYFIIRDNTKQVNNTLIFEQVRSLNEKTVGDTSTYNAGNECDTATVTIFIRLSDTMRSQQIRYCSARRILKKLNLFIIATFNYSTKGWNLLMKMRVKMFFFCATIVSSNASWPTIFLRNKLQSSEKLFKIRLNG